MNIIILSDFGYPIARKIKSEFGGTIHGLQSRCSKSDSTFVDTKQKFKESFVAGEPLVAIMASGAVIRLLADLLDDKHSEPPVIAIAEDGSSVVPLLGGHHGANEFASKLADLLDSHAAITTAGDLRFGVALDSPPEGWVLANPDNAKNVMAAMLNGRGSAVAGSVSQWCKVAHGSQSAVG